MRHWLLVMGIAALPAQADVATDEQELLAACQADGSTEERCQCYLQVIQSEAGPDNYARAIALAVAGTKKDQALLAETRRQFGLSEADIEVLIRTMQSASNRAAIICDPLPVPGQGG